MRNFSADEFDKLVQATKLSQQKKFDNSLKTPIKIKCVVCDTHIKPSCESDEEKATEYANNTSFANGAVGTISFEYGCGSDGDVLIIGICEDCYKKKLENGGVLYAYNYIP